MEWMGLSMELASQCNSLLFGGGIGVAAGLIVYLAYSEWRCLRARRAAKFWMTMAEKWQSLAEREVRSCDELLGRTKKICESVPGWKEASDEYDEIMRGKRGRKLH